MNALRAVPSNSDSRADGEHLTTDDDPIDLSDDPRTDPEALLLCALMWTSDDEEASRIADAVTVADFERAAYVELFERIRELIRSHRPHDPASVLAELVRAGADGQHGAPIRLALTDLTIAGAPGASATHYADVVLSQSYRRSFHLAGQRLMQAAEQGPEDELFDYMIELGRAQRTATRRLSAFRAGTVAVAAPVARS